MKNNQNNEVPLTNLLQLKLKNMQVLLVELFRLL